jgi:hypothetical protein
MLAASLLATFVLRATHINLIVSVSVVKPVSVRGKKKAGSQPPDSASFAGKVSWNRRYGEASGTSTSQFHEEERGPFLVSV